MGHPMLELASKMRFCCAQCWNWTSSAGTGCPVLELDDNLVTSNWHWPHTGTGANMGCPILALVHVQVCQICVLFWHCFHCTGAHIYCDKCVVTCGNTSYQIRSIINYLLILVNAILVDAPMTFEVHFKPALKHAHLLDAG